MLRVYSIVYPNGGNKPIKRLILPQGVKLEDVLKVLRLDMENLEVTLEEIA